MSVGLVRILVPQLEPHRHSSQPWAAPESLLFVVLRGRERAAPPRRPGGSRAAAGQGPVLPRREAAGLAAPAVLPPALRCPSLLGAPCVQ